MEQGCFFVHIGMEQGCFFVNNHCTIGQVQLRISVLGGELGEFSCQPKILSGQCLTADYTCCTSQRQVRDYPKYLPKMLAGHLRSKKLAYMSGATLKFGRHTYFARLPINYICGTFDLAIYPPFLLKKVRKPILINLKMNIFQK